MQEKWAQKRITNYLEIVERDHNIFLTVLGGEFQNAIGIGLVMGQSIWKSDVAWARHGPGLVVILKIILNWGKKDEINRIKLQFR